jgi:hypothetical protein
MTANAGYHAYTTGDVLTAAQVQYNLQNQTVMYFATTTARDAVLTGAILVEGLVSYTPATAIMYYNGSAWTAISAAAFAYQTKTAAYTFIAGDENDIIAMNAATTQQFSIPTDATYNFSIGSEITVTWLAGAVGQPTIGAVTPGTTTLVSTGATSATPKLRVANSGATCKKLAANSWIVFGDLA